LLLGELEPAGDAIRGDALKQRGGRPGAPGTQGSPRRLVLRAVRAARSRSTQAAPFPPTTKRPAPTPAQVGNGPSCSQRAVARHGRNYTIRWGLSRLHAQGVVFQPPSSARRRG